MKEELNKGNWYWFWNEGSTIPTLGKFYEKINGLYYVENKMYAFHYYEPYKGELPKLVKEGIHNSYSLCIPSEG